MTENELPIQANNESIKTLFWAKMLLLAKTMLLLLTIYAGIRILMFLLDYIKLQRLVADMPGPKEKSFLKGSFFNSSNDSHQRLMQFSEWCNEYGKEKGFVRAYSIGCMPFILACSPSAVSQLLKSQEPKYMGFFSIYRTMQEWMGADSMLLSSGKVWARMRRLLTPTFHFEVLKSHTHVYNQASDVLVENFAKFADTKESFDFVPYITRCSMDILLRSVFSNTFTDDRFTQTSKTEHPYIKAVNALAIAITNRNRDPLLLTDTVFYNCEMGRQYKQNCDYVHSVADEIIRTRRAQLEQNGSSKNKKHMDFIDLLLSVTYEDGKGLTDLEIRNQANTFLQAGHDTTSSSINWVLFSLASHPEHQQRCQQEIDAILEGRESDDILWTDLPKLTYLTMCIKEGQRLHGPVPHANGIKTTQNLVLNGTVIPPGVVVMANLWMLHHNEEVWGKDHMSFKPERFSEENIAKMHPFQFLPFSGGARNCIGKNVGTNEAKIMLAKLLYNFRFTLVPGQDVRKSLAIVLRPANGVYVTLERRKH